MGDGWSFSVRRIALSLFVPVAILAGLCGAMPSTFKTTKTSAPSKSADAKANGKLSPCQGSAYDTDVEWHITGAATIRCASPADEGKPILLYAASDGWAGDVKTSADTDGNLLISVDVCDPAQRKRFYGAREIDGVLPLDSAFTPRKDEVRKAAPCSQDPSDPPSAAPDEAPPRNVYEDRFIAVLMNAGDSSGPHVLAYLNPEGHCAIDGSSVMDGSHASCTGAKKTLDRASACPGNEFCGTVSVPYEFVREQLHLYPREDVALCSAVTDGAVKEEDLIGDCNSSHAFRRLRIQQDDGDRGAPRAWQTLSQVTQKSSVKRASSASPSPQATGQNSSLLAISGVFVSGVSDRARLSVGVQSLDTSFLDKRYRDFLSDVAQTFGTTSPSGMLETNSLNYKERGSSLGALPKSWVNDQFDKLDTSPFEQAVQEPVRFADALPFADRHTALKPLDFGAIPKYNYGGKFIWKMPSGIYGIAYYRNFANDEIRSGSAQHIEEDWQDLKLGTWSIGFLNVGLTNVVANRGSASYSDDNNGYVKRLHSQNLVGEAALGFGPASRFKLLFHSGSVNTGADRMTVLSYAESTMGWPIDADGSSIKPHASIGYRAVDAGYDPLATTYDEFTGTKTVFATAGVDVTLRGEYHAQPFAQVSVARSFDALQARYSSLQAKIGSNFFKDDKTKATLLYQRADVAASVWTKEAGKYVLTDTTGGRQMLRNDLWDFEIAYDNKIAGGMNLTAGTGWSWATTPTDCSTKTSVNPCTSKFVSKPNLKFSLSGTPWLVSFSAEPASKQNSSKDGGTSSGSATNQPHLTGLVDVCFPWGNALHVQPRFAYDTNTSDGISAYVPGHLFEPGIDFIVPAQQVALRVGWKQVYDAKWLPEAQQYHGFEVKVLYMSSGGGGDIDSCAHKASKDSSGS